MNKIEQTQTKNYEYEPCKRTIMNNFFSYRNLISSSDLNNTKEAQITRFMSVEKSIKITYEYPSKQRRPAQKGIIEK